MTPIVPKRSSWSTESIEQNLRCAGPKELGFATAALTIGGLTLSVLFCPQAANFLGRNYLFTTATFTALFGAAVLYDVNGRCKNPELKRPSCEHRFTKLNPGEKSYINEVALLILGITVVGVAALGFTNFALHQQKVLWTAYLSAQAAIDLSLFLVYLLRGCRSLEAKKNFQKEQIQLQKYKSYLQSRMSLLEKLKTSHNQDLTSLRQLKEETIDQTEKRFVENYFGALVTYIGAIDRIMDRIINDRSPANIKHCAQEIQSQYRELEIKLIDIKKELSASPLKSKALSVTEVKQYFQYFKKEIEFFQTNSDGLLETEVFFFHLLNEFSYFLGFFQTWEEFKSDCQKIEEAKSILVVKGHLLSQYDEQSEEYSSSDLSSIHDDLKTVATTLIEVAGKIQQNPIFATNQSEERRRRG